MRIKQILTYIHTYILTSYLYLSSKEWFTKRFRTAMIGVNIGIPVPREPFSFGGLYGTKSKFGDFDITGVLILIPKIICNLN